MSARARLSELVRGMPHLQRLRIGARQSPRGSRTVVAGLALALIFAGGFFWLRDSALVAVDEVSVSGLTSENAGEIRSALVRAGHGMTSLHVDQAALERAVSEFPEVRALEARGDFPGGLRITVVERLPVAVVVGETRVAVAGDGTVLLGLEDPDGLPEVRVEGGTPAGRLGAGEARDVVSVLGKAPAALGPKLEKGLLDGERGVVVQVSDGPELVFGAAEQVSAKWAAAARVLADGESAGAEYIDLTIPERPAAGGLAAETPTPIGPAGEEITPAPGPYPSPEESQP